MSATTLDAQLRRVLQTVRRPDGGFPPLVGGSSEVESTAVAALALDDRRAREWLLARQQSDGGFRELDGRRAGPATAAVAALALGDRVAAARRALGFAISSRGLPPPDVPQDRRQGWGWTPDARSLVEPTARVLLAVKHLTPSDTSTRREAVRLLEERRCSDGGWNYGNASHLDVDLLSYAQTTAIALISLLGEESPSIAPAFDYLRRSWRREPGVLTLAQTLLAFRLHGAVRDASAVEERLEAARHRKTFAARPLAVAWATLAAGPEQRLVPFGGRG
jgi:hypothetical protein